MNLILKKDPVWLDCIPTPDVSATLLLLGGDGQQVAVPVPLLLAVSPVVRSILTDHLPPAYSPCCFSLPATTGDVLQVFGEIIGTGAGAHADKIEEVRQVFQMLGVEALIVSCRRIQSIQLGLVLDRDIKKESSTEVSCISLDEENTCKLEINVKIEPKENIGVKVESEESESFEIGQPCRQNMTKKSSLNIQQSPSSTTREKYGNLKKNANLSEAKKRKESPLSPILRLNLQQNPTSSAAHDKIENPCNLCTVKFSSKSKLKVNVESVHGRELLCNLCPLKFTQESQLLMHVGSVHNKKIPCSLCPQQFTLIKNLLRHVKSVHDKIEIPCNICPQKFTQKDNLLRHVKSVHNKIEIPCNLCPQMFSQKSHLLRHVQSVHDKSEFPCNLCPLKYPLKESLLRHVKAVHDKIQSSCNFCSQKFTLKQSLKRHIENVHKKIKYPCSLCPQKFTLKHHVVRHIEAVHKNPI